MGKWGNGEAEEWRSGGAANVELLSMYVAGCEEQLDTFDCVRSSLGKDHSFDQDGRICGPITVGDLSFIPLRSAGVYPEQPRGLC